jgi:hypothetical protein
VMQWDKVTILCKFVDNNQDTISMTRGGQPFHKIH